jgi:hypothetical protein
MVVGNGAKRGASGAIDVRGRNGYVVVPPSIHSSEYVYEWEPGLAPWETTLAPLPDALAPLMKEARVRDGTAVPPLRSGLSSRVKFLLDARLGIRRLWNGEGKRVGDTSASGYDHAFALALLEAKVAPREAAAAVAARPDAHRRDADYAWQTTQAAQRYLKAKTRRPW